MIVKSHLVHVWGKPIEITVSQQSSSVWLARGIYHGESFEVKGSSEGSAVKTWKDAAKYRGG